MTTPQKFARAKPSAALALPTALPALGVPVADPVRGIIPIDELDSDVIVLVPWSGGMKNSDSIRLYWDGAVYGDPVDLSEVDLGLPDIQFELLIKVADFPANGTDVDVSLDYEIFDTASEDGQLSNLPVVVTFDRCAPGGVKLPPISFSEEQLTGITVGDLVNGILELIIEPFYDSDQDDNIELWLGTSDTEGIYLSPSFYVGDPNASHPVTISETDLTTTPDGPKYFGYRVTDWAGNISALSDLVMIPVFLDLPTLPAPLVPESVDGLITYNDAVDTVGVEVPHFDGAAVGDSIYVIWSGVTLPPYPITNNDADPLVTIAVPYDIVAQFPQVTDLVVSYWLQRAGTPRMDSPETLVNVNLTTPGGPDPDPDPETPEHENIKAPDINCGTSPVNTITPGDYGQNATATIFRVGVDLNPIWLINDEIQLYWGTPPTAVGSPLTVVSANQGSNINIPVPFAGIIEGSTGAVPVFFTITRVLDGTNAVTVKSMVQTVTVTSSGELPGDGGPLAQGIFPEANANNIITRAAGIDGTTFRITLAGVTNIELTKNPRISYDFVGVRSLDATDPGAAPIDDSRLEGDDIPITQAMLTAGYFEVELPYSRTYLICRNGAILDYSIRNDSGPIAGLQKFVRFAMNQGGGTCSLP
ncbi:MAG: hypothetical protein JWQ16_3543 [Novosphingobium sp.]|nr:hypothetical protein [Novosphingobium sp.]